MLDRGRGRVSRAVALGLGLVSGACVIPHHERFASSWAPRLSKALPEALVVGIDEETGLRFDGPTGSWEVCGRGAVTVYQSKGRRVHGPGSRVALPGVAVSAAGPA